MTSDPIPTAPKPSARILDISRLISRAGRHATGVDRVDSAYLRRFLAELEPVFGLVRTSLGFVLLDRAGLLAVHERIEGRADWGPSDRISRIMRRLDDGQKRAQSDVRRFAFARCRKHRLRKMLKRHVPKGAVYVNVGHSNLSDRVLEAVRNGPQARVVVMIHDTIPLDFPEYQTPQAVTRFKGLLRRVRAFSDLVIYNSDQTRRDAERHMAAWGDVPDGVVALLGIDAPAPDASQIPDGAMPEGPYFVSVGTIEPRKNHAFLLDLWEDIQADAPDPVPQLVICGARGWNNEAVFARLDAIKGQNAAVSEVANLTDPALMAMIQGSRGLLFPSHAEGFGLPPVEAITLGVPVICPKLPIYREILGDIPVYADTDDRYLWRSIINDLTKGRRAGQVSQVDAQARVSLLSWDAHFNAILKVT